MEPSLVVLEGGIALRPASGGDLWSLEGPDDPTYLPYGDLLAQLSPLRPIAIEYPSGIREEPLAFLVAGDRGPPLEFVLEVAANASASLTDTGYVDLQRVHYIASAALYHTHQLIRRYRAALASIYARGALPPTDNFFTINLVEQYFEFEAQVTTVVRAFDTLRFLLWHAFGPKGSVPANLAKALAQLDLPPALVQPCRSALAFYLEAKEYRHCLQHYAHFGAHLPGCRFIRVGTLGWRATALIPDNPATRSYSAFSFDKSRDALSYAWTLANALIELLSAIVPLLPPTVHDAG